MGNPFLEAYQRGKKAKSQLQKEREKAELFQSVAMDIGLDRYAQKEKKPLPEIFTDPKQMVAEAAARLKENAAPEADSDDVLRHKRGAAEAVKNEALALKLFQRYTAKQLEGVVDDPDGVAKALRGGFIRLSEEEIPSLTGLARVLSENPGLVEEFEKQGKGAFAKAVLRWGTETGRAPKPEVFDNWQWLRTGLTHYASGVAKAGALVAYMEQRGLEKFAGFFGEKADNLLGLPVSPKAMLAIQLGSEKLFGQIETTGQTVQNPLLKKLNEFILNDPESAEWIALADRITDEMLASDAPLASWYRRHRSYFAQHPWKTLGGEMVGYILEGLATGGVSALSGAGLMEGGAAAVRAGGEAMSRAMMRVGVDEAVSRVLGRAIAGSLGAGAAVTAQVAPRLPGLPGEMAAQTPGLFVGGAVIHAGLHAPATILRLGHVSGVGKALDRAFDEVISARIKTASANLTARVLETGDVVAAKRLLKRAGILTPENEAILLSSTDEASLRSLFEGAMREVAKEKLAKLQRLMRRTAADYGKRLRKQDAALIATETANAELSAMAAGRDLKIDVNFVSDAIVADARDVARFHPEAKKGEKTRVVGMIETSVKSGIGGDDLGPAVRMRISLLLSPKPGAVAKVYIHELAHGYLDVLRRADPQLYEMVMTDLAYRVSRIAGEHVSPRDLMANPALATEQFVKLLEASRILEVHKQLADSSSPLGRAVKRFGGWAADVITWAKGMRRMMGLDVVDEGELKADEVGRLLWGHEERVAGPMPRRERWIPNIRKSDREALIEAERGYPGRVSTTMDVYRLTFDETVKDFREGNWENIFAVFDQNSETEDVAGKIQQFFEVNTADKNGDAAIEYQRWDPTDVVSVKVAGLGRVKVPRLAHPAVIHSLESGKVAHGLFPKALSGLIKHGLIGDGQRYWYQKGKIGLSRLRAHLHERIPQIARELKEQGLVSSDRPLDPAFFDDILTDDFIIDMVGHTAAARAPKENLAAAVKATAFYHSSDRPVRFEMEDTKRFVHAVFNSWQRTVRWSEDARGIYDAPAEDILTDLADMGHQRYQKLLRKGKEGAPAYPAPGETYGEWIQKTHAPRKLYNYTESIRDPESLEPYCCDRHDASFLLWNQYTEVRNEMLRIGAELDDLPPEAPEAKELIAKFFDAFRKQRKMQLENKAKHQAIRREIAQLDEELKAVLKERLKGRAEKKAETILEAAEKQQKTIDELRDEILKLSHDLHKRASKAEKQKIRAQIKEKQAEIKRLLEAYERGEGYDKAFGTGAAFQDAEFRQRVVELLAKRAQLTVKADELGAAPSYYDMAVPGRILQFNVDAPSYGAFSALTEAQIEVFNKIYLPKLRSEVDPNLPEMRKTQAQAIRWFFAGGGMEEEVDWSQAGVTFQELVDDAIASGEMDEWIRTGLIEADKANLMAEGVRIPVEFAPGLSRDMRRFFGTLQAILRKAVENKKGQVTPAKEREIAHVMSRLATPKTAVRRLAAGVKAYNARVGKGLGFWQAGGEGATAGQVDLVPNGVIVVDGNLDSVIGLAHAMAAAKWQQAIWLSTVHDIGEAVTKPRGIVIDIPWVSGKAEPNKLVTPDAIEDVVNVINRMLRETTGEAPYGWTAEIDANWRGIRLLTDLGIFDDPTFEQVKDMLEALAKIRELARARQQGKYAKYLNIGGFKVDIWGGDTYYSEVTPKPVHKGGKTLWTIEEFRSYNGNRESARPRLLDAEGRPVDGVGSKHDAEHLAAAWHLGVALRKAAEAGGSPRDVLRDVLVEWRQPYTIARTLAASPVRESLGVRFDWHIEGLRKIADGEPLRMLARSQPEILASLGKDAEQTLLASVEAADKVAREIAEEVRSAIVGKEKPPQGLGGAGRIQDATKALKTAGADFTVSYETAPETPLKGWERAVQQAEVIFGEPAAKAAEGFLARSVARVADLFKKRTTVTDDVALDQVTGPSTGPAERMGFLEALRMHERSLVSDRFATLDVFDPEVANQFSLWAVTPVRVRVAARRAAEYVTQGLTEAEKEQLVRYGWHVRRQAIIKSGVDPATVKLPEMSPAEVAEVRSNPKIQQAIARWQEVWAEQVTPMRLALGLSEDALQEVEGGFFMSLIPYDENVHGPEAKVWSGGRASIPRRFTQKKTKFRLKATGSAEAYLMDPEAILYHSMAPDAVQYEIKNTLDLMQKKGLLRLEQPTEPFIDARGKAHRWRKVTVQIPQYFRVPTSEPGKTRPVYIPPKEVWMPEKLATTFEREIIGRNVLGTWRDSIAFKAWNTASGKATGLMLASLVEFVAHSQRVLGRLATIPAVDVPVSQRIAELAVPYLGPRLSSLWKIVTGYARADTPLYEAVVARVGGFPSRTVANEQALFTKGVAGKVANKILHFGREMLFGMPEMGKYGIKGFDVRARVVALRMWYHDAKITGRLGDLTLEDLAKGPTPFDAEIRHFLSQFGSFTTQLQHDFVAFLRETTNPFTGSQVGMRPAEIKAMFGFSGLGKGGNALYKSLLWGETLYRMTVGPVIFHSLLNKALSGHWPWENEPGREFFLDTGMRDDDGAPIYIHPRIMFPGLMRASRTTGVKFLFDERYGLTVKDRMQVLPNRMTNEALNVFFGAPLTRAISVAGTGRVPYLGADWMPMRVARPRVSLKDQFVENIKTAFALSNPMIEGLFDEWAGELHEIHHPVLRWVAKTSQFVTGKFLTKGKPPVIAGGEAMRLARSNLDEVQRWMSYRYVDAWLLGDRDKQQEVLREFQQELAKSSLPAEEKVRRIKEVMMSPARLMVSKAKQRAITEREKRRMK